MLNNGAKWYNFSPPRWSFIAPPLTPRSITLVVVAAEYNTHYIFANVMDVTFDCRYNKFAV